MIQVNRRLAKAPAAFTTAASAESKKLRATHGRATNIPSSDFNTGVWQDRLVRSALLKMQHDKCVYCEWSIPLEYNDVEHFRPKSKYWWLAYAWRNLFYACPQCNRSAKNDSFVLATGKAPLRPSQRPTLAEGHLLIHPCDENPADFIEFRFIPGPNEWMPVGVDAQGRGDHSIHLVELDRPFLVEQREIERRHFDEILQDWDAAVIARDLARQATVKARADSRRAPAARFSRFAQCYLARVQ